MSDAQGEVGVSAKQLERWFQEFYPAVFHFFFNRGFDREDCHDLAQETFVAAFRGRAQFRGQAKIRTWIFSIAQNLWKNQLRRSSQKKRKGTLISLDGRQNPNHTAPIQIESGDGNPLERLLEDERMRRLLKAMRELPEKMQRCAYLRYGQHLKYAEIAVLLHVSIDTVKSHLFQANQRLKLKLSEHFPELQDPPTGGNDE